MKKVLVYGLGVTGISSVKALGKLGYEVYTYDKNKKHIKELEGYTYSPISDFKFENFDFVLKSPGIKPSDEIVKILEKDNDIVSDIELSQRLFPNKEKIAITGTNGKTSTTSMLAHILNETGHPALAVGNIGEGILWQMYKNDKIFVEELSSFQLHDTSTFKPHIGAILNIKEDHIDWHESFDNYVISKLKLAKNQSKDDFLVINKEDEISQRHKKDFKAQIYEFSSLRPVKRGLFLDGDKIFLSDGSSSVEEILDVKDLQVIGRHNYENIMAAILLSYLLGIEIVEIVEAIKKFKAIAHRLEYVKTLSGIDFYNDSKGTNVASSVKAIESFDKKLIVIAGGYDKNIDYTDFVKAFKKNGKTMILMGQTKEKLKDLCDKNHIENILVNDLRQAVSTAYDLAKKDEVILLSPASASWDMYKSYEERGDEFKKLVVRLEEK